MVSYDGGVNDVTAIVLAGGRSSRMGRDKAMLQFAGETLLERALRNARHAAGCVLISGSRALYGGYGEVVEDVYPDRGPLGGVHAGLAASATELNLVLSVDMPRMSAEFLTWLSAEARSGEQLITIPRAMGELQPLCGIYRKELAELVERSLRAGLNKVGRLFSLAPTRIVSEAEILEAGFTPEMFTNVNTPEEYAATVAFECAPEKGSPQA